MATVKYFLLLCFVCSVTSICMEDYSKLTCFNELTIEDYHFETKTLILTDSFVSVHVFKDKLPNVRTVYVSVVYTAEVCTELKTLVTIYGCQGNGPSFHSHEQIDLLV